MRRFLIAAAITGMLPLSSVSANPHVSIHVNAGPGRGVWQSPYRYRVFVPGGRVAAVYYAPRYVVTAPAGYRPARRSADLVWVRHYGDAVLVNARTGRVIDVRRGFYR